jgi:hypothetical protein
MKRKLTKQWKAWFTLLMAFCAFGMANAQINVAGDTNFPAGAVSYTSCEPTNWNRSNGYDGQDANTFLDGGEKGSTPAGVVTYTLNVTNPGRYNIIVRAGTCWGDQMTVKAFINDTEVGITPAFTGNGGNWFTCASDRTAIPADLCVGSHILKLEVTGAASVTRITLTRTGDAATCGPQAPSIKANNPSGVSATAATLNATLAAKGTENVTAKGIRWGTNNPGTPNSTSWGNGIAEITDTDLPLGAFSADITGLTNGQTYYYYAYATNSVGTSYSDVVSFVAEDCVPAEFSICLWADIDKTQGTNGFMQGGASQETNRAVPDNVCGKNGWGSLNNNPVMAYKVPEGVCAGTYTVSLLSASANDQNNPTAKLGTTAIIASMEATFTISQKTGWDSWHYTTENNPEITIDGTGDNLYFAPSQMNSARLVFTPVVPPASPVISVTQIGEQKLSVSWNEVSGAKSYDVYISNNEGLTFDAPINVTEPAYITISLEIGEKYCFKVVAKNDAGSSGDSNVACATITDPTTIDEDADLFCDDVVRTDNLVEYWTIKSRNESSFLQDDENNDAGETNGRLRNGAANANNISARWILESQGGDQYRYKNLATGRYITMNNDCWDGANNTNHNTPSLTYNVSDDQRNFYRVANGDYFQIQSRRWEGGAGGHWWNVNNYGNCGNNNNNIWASQTGTRGNAFDFEITHYPYTVYPDIVVNSISFTSPSTIALGDEVSGTLQIQNIAPNGVVANGTAIKIRLAFNGQFFYVSYDGGLYVSTIVNVPFSFTPNKATESASLVATANSNYTIEELDCSNNSRTSTTTIEIIDCSEIEITLSVVGDLEKITSVVVPPVSSEATYQWKESSNESMEPFRLISFASELPLTNLRPGTDLYYQLIVTDGVCMSESEPLKVHKDISIVPNKHDYAVNYVSANTEENTISVQVQNLGNVEILGSQYTIAFEIVETQTKVLTDLSVRTGLPNLPVGDNSIHELTADFNFEANASYIIKATIVPRAAFLLAIGGAEANTINNTFTTTVCNKQYDGEETINYYINDSYVNNIDSLCVLHFKTFEGAMNHLKSIEGFVNKNGDLTKNIIFNVYYPYKETDKYFENSEKTFEIICHFWTPKNENDTIIWTGKIDSDWDKADNWYNYNSINPLPETVVAIIPAPVKSKYYSEPVDNYPVLQTTPAIVKYSNDLVVNKLIVEYGASLFTTPLHGKVSEVQTDLWIDNRVDWQLVGPNIRPFDGEGVTRPMRSGDYFLDYYPHVYMHEVLLVNDDGDVLASAGEPFASIYKEISPDKAFAIRVPNQYGPTKNVASYVYRNDPYRINLGEEPVLIRFNGDFQNAVEYNVKANEYTIITNTFMAPIDIERFVQQYGGTVYVLEVGTGHNVGGSIYASDLNNINRSHIRPMASFFFKSDIDQTIIMNEAEICDINKSYRAQRARSLSRPMLEIQTSYNEYGSTGTFWYNEQGENIPNLTRLFVDTDAPQVFAYNESESESYERFVFDNANTKIPLGIRFTKNEKVKFKVTGAEQFEKVFLDDNMTGKIYDLQEEPEFELDLTSGKNKDRFELRFIAFDGGTVDIENPQDEKDVKHLKIYTENNESIIVISPNDLKIQEVMIIDMSGKILKTISTSSNYVKIDMSSYPAAVYTVKVITAEKTKTEKVKIK